MSTKPYALKYVFTADNGFHAAGGFVIGAILLLGLWWPWSLAATVPVTQFAWGLVREKAQDPDTPWLSTDWLHTNKLWEAGSWGVGAALAVVALGLVRWLA